MVPSFRLRLSGYTGQTAHCPNCGHTLTLGTQPCALNLLLFTRTSLTHLKETRLNVLTRL